MRSRRLAAAVVLALASAGCAAPVGLDTDAIPRGELRPLPASYTPHRPDFGSTRDLGAFFAALAAQDAKPAGAPISIVQIGDSHSAGDYLSARLRELFQARFGAAGRGMLPPGFPDKYYKPKLVTVTESDGWQRISSRDASAVAAFGVGGVVQQAAAAGETMTLTSDEPDGFDRVAIDFRRRPDGGSLLLSVDGGAPVTISTRGPARVVRAIFATAPHSRALTLQTAGDGTVELTGWGSWRHGSGVLYQNFGVIGAQADSLERYDRQALATELADASLVVVVFGTNEAFAPASDVADYRARFIASVRVLRDAAPHASILIVGPPDVNRSVTTASAAGLVCQQETQPQTALPSVFVDYTQQAGPAGQRGHNAQGRAVVRPVMQRPMAAWVRPAQVDTVLQVQRADAAQHGWYFWDWSAAMGGPCAMTTWVASGLGRSDHVHMTTDGYSRSAELLFADVMERYDAWVRQKTGKPQRSEAAPGVAPATETAAAPQ